jgi:hypothetical protein
LIKIPGCCRLSRDDSAEPTFAADSQPAASVYSKKLLPPRENLRDLVHERHRFLLPFVLDSRQPWKRRSIGVGFSPAILRT